MPTVTSRADVGVHGADDVGDLVRQRASVGVAQHDVAGALDDRRLEGAQGELRVGLVAVEEVLHVDEHQAALAAQELDGIGDHRLALVERGLQRLGHVVLGALGDDAHGRCLRLDEVAQSGVVVDLAARPAGRAEGDERARRQVELDRGTGEELDVLRVGARPAALDVVHAERVELLGDAQLVLDRGRDALDLQAVAEGRVEDLDGPTLLFHVLRSDGRAPGTFPVNGRSRPEGGFSVHAAWPRALTNDDDRGGALV